MEDNRLKGSPFGAPPQNINVKEDLLKLFRGLIGQKSIEEQLEEQPGVGTEFKIKTPEAVQQIGDLERGLASLPRAIPREGKLGAVVARPTKQQIADANTPRLGDKIDLIKKRESVGDTNYLQKGETKKPKAKEKSITSQSDFIVDDYFLNHFKNNEGIKKILGPGAEGGKTDDIAHGHKLLGDEITTKMVYGIDVSKGVTDEQSDTIARLDIQGERGVNRAIREFNQVMKENNIKKNFKDLEKWKQNLLIDFSLNNAPAKNLAKALANNNITDIVENATDRTFKRKNNEGVLVRKYQSKRNEDTYKNLIEPFIKDSVSEEKLKYYLEEVLKRKGFYNRKKHNKIIEKQSGGIVRDPYKREPRFI